MAESAAAPRSARRDAAAVAGVTLVALVLRVIGANSGLWIDEIYALLNSFRMPLADTLSRYPHDNHHPLYSALAHLSLVAFGESPWAIRLPSILFGAATVPMLYVLGKRLAGHREALLAAALLAVSWHHVWFSQNARGYAMMAFFAVACTWLILRLLDEGGARLALAYAACAALGAYTHLTMIFIVVGHAVAAGLVLLNRSRGSGQRTPIGPVALAFALAAGFTLLLHAPMMSDIVAYFTNRPSGLKGVSTTGWALAETIRVLVAGFGAGSLALGTFVVGCAAVLFVVGIASVARRSPAALAMFLAPVAVIFAGAAVARGTFYPRFLFALIGFGILIGVRGVMACADAAERRFLAVRAGGASHRLGTAVIALAVILSLVTVLRTANLPKQDFAGAAAYATSHRAMGDRIATVGVTTIPLRDYLHVDVAEVATGRDVAALRAEGGVWLVYAFPRYLAASAPEVMDLIRSACRTPAVFRGTTGDGNVMVCRLERTA